MENLKKELNEKLKEAFPNSDLEFKNGRIVGFLELKDIEDKIFFYPVTMKMYEDANVFKMKLELEEGESYDYNFAPNIIHNYMMNFEALHNEVDYLYDLNDAILDVLNEKTKELMTFTVQELVKMGNKKLADISMLLIENKDKLMKKYKYDEYVFYLRLDEILKDFIKLKNEEYEKALGLYFKNKGQLGMIAINTKELLNVLIYINTECFSDVKERLSRM